MNVNSRKILKASRRNTATLRDNTTNESAVGLFGNKRKFDSSISSKRNLLNNNEFQPNNSANRYLDTSPPKFSANNRLKKYRTSLDNRKNEIVKVHQVLNPPISPTNSCERNTISTNCTKPISKSPSKTINHSEVNKRLLKKKSDHIQDCVNDEIASKKSKIAECTINVTESIKIERSNINNTCKNDFDMDWSPIDENEVLFNIQKLRNDIKEKLVPLLDTSPLATKSCSVEYLQTAMKNKPLLYIVVDTNIFISHLNLIENLLIEDCKQYDHLVYVPWMVIQELDYFKDGRAESPALLKAAKKAVKFINENLIKKQARLRGQTVQEALNQKGSSSNADDNILFCCISLAQASKTVILLSNDVNLRNKALINEIASYGPKNVLTKIKDFNMNEENKKKIHQINSEMTNMCTEIILAEMEESYGSVLYRLITKPPWDLKQCLVYFKRFWSPVFSLLINQKQCLMIIENLLQFMQTCSDLTKEDNLEEFIKLSLSLCVYFKNCLQKYQKSVIFCINNVQKIAS